MLTSSPPSHSDTRQSFTLIELLIVVAIIGILAAIAVPNFLNAQIRARISRAWGDLNAISTGIKMSQMDRNVLLVDFWDDDQPWGTKRIEYVFHGVGKGQGERTLLDILSPLTTPIVYMNSLPKDPFESQTYFGSFLSEYYGYADNDPESNAPDHGIPALRPERAQQLGLQPLNEGDYILGSVGPDGIWGLFQSSSSELGEIAIPFNMSNGIQSIGDITLRGNGTINR